MQILVLLAAAHVAMFILFYFMRSGSWLSGRVKSYPQIIDKALPLIGQIGKSLLRPKKKNRRSKCLVSK